MPIIEDTLYINGVSSYKISYNEAPSVTDFTVEERVSYDDMKLLTSCLTAQGYHCLPFTSMSFICSKGQ